MLGSKQAYHNDGLAPRPQSCSCGWCPAENYGPMRLGNNSTYLFTNLDRYAELQVMNQDNADWVAKH